MEGWIKLHRVLLKKPIWTCSNCLQKTLLITLLLKANHKENEWVWKGEKYKLQPGQFITSAESLEKEIGKEASRQKIRSALALFEKLGFLTIKTTNKNTLITIVNWELYQGGNDEDNQQPNNQITNKQPSNNHQITTNKNDKNIKNEKNDKKIKEYFLELHDFWKQRKKMPLSVNEIRVLEDIAEVYFERPNWVEEAMKKVSSTITTPSYLKGVLDHFKATGEEEPWNVSTAKNNGKARGTAGNPRHTPTLEEWKAERERIERAKKGNSDTG